MEKSTHRAVVVPVKLEKHVNSDHLSIVKFDAGQVVVQTSLWEGKDKGVFIPCENKVDTSREEFKFFAKNDRWRKVTPCKLRGVISQGLLIQCPEGKNIGDNLTEYYEIVHCEDVQDTGTFAQTAKPPSGYNLSKYDIDGPKNYIQDFVQDEEVVITQKIHGANARYLCDAEGIFHIGSRGEWKSIEKGEVFAAALKTVPQIETFCQNNKELTLYGEVYGMNKPNYTYGLAPGQRSFIAFDIRRKDGTYLDYDKFMSLCYAQNVPTVPELYRGPWSRDKVIEMSESVCMLTGKDNAEGCVVKPVKERLNRRFERLIYKVIGTKYKI